MRVVEAAAFVAAPLGGMTLAQLGADVIRMDPIGGGLDYKRWPVTTAGDSLYWAGLNKGKRSIALDLASAEGRELATALITAPGADAGIFLTNYPPQRVFDYESLRQRRPDLIMCQITGNADGSTAVDYTVNAAVGFPLITGPPDFTGVVNSVLPAWDLITGMTAATGLLAAERYRRRSGQGRLLRLALSDVALAVLGHLGHIAEVQVNDEDRPRLGNHLFGAFGRDFSTADGRQLMVVAITPRQFRGLVEATGLADQVAELENRTGRPLESDGDLFAARHDISALLEKWCQGVTLAEAATVLEQHRVVWGPYQTVRQLLSEDPRASVGNPMFSEVEHPGLGRYLTPASPLQAPGNPPARRAPRLGEHTDEILTEILGLSDTEVGRLHSDAVIAGARGSSPVGRSRPTDPSTT
jgi:2-methylfumaryl-CoA isomerase